MSMNMYGDAEDITMSPRDVVNMSEAELRTYIGYIGGKDKHDRDDLERALYKVATLTHPRLGKS